MRSFAFALVIAGGTMLGVPALAMDPVMPQPVTDYLPPATDEAPPPVTDDTPPTAGTPDTELPTPAADAVASPPPPVCGNCPTPNRYDSQEVIRKIREIDRSRTINTTEMVPDYAPRHDTPRGYRLRSDVTLVNFVVHRYRVIFAPELAPPSDGEYRPLHRAHRVACKYGKRDRYGSCRPLLRVHGYSGVDSD